ncbi:MAG: fused MFS/spermidine synthase, partial [Candidatus Theseobacter exili]|nr:fused MFS/spermidine synthase [Candidatus Theseobacter exili]
MKILIFYFLSGFTALIYEVVWARQLLLFFGSNALALSTVIAAFMAGFAAGSAVCGRFFSRIRPLKVYGVFEILIGLYAVFSPLIFHMLFKWNTDSSFQTEGQFFIISLQRFGLSFLVVFFPAFFMGGTFPVMCRAYVHDKSKIGKGTGLLYGINTVGAAAGAFFAGYFFISLYGISRTIWIASAINIVIGIAAFLLPQTSKEKNEKIFKEKLSIPLISETKRSLWLLLCVLAFFAGGSAMTYEVLWTRAMSLVIGSSVYAFSMVLTAFLAGTAIGSWSVAWWADKFKKPLALLIFLQAGVFVSVIFTIPLIGKLPELFLKWFIESDQSFVTVQIIKFGICSVILFVPTMLSGAFFPALVRTSIKEIRGLPKRAGSLYAVNSTGCIVGSFLAGFYILPTLGLRNGLIAGASINLLLSAIAITAMTKRILVKFSVIVACAMIALAAFLLIPSMDMNIMTSGPSIYVKKYTEDMNVKQTLKNLNMVRLLSSREGLSGNVSVKEYGKIRSLLINGKVEGSDGHDMDTQILASSLPMMLSNDVQDVLLIGLGTGVTLRGILSYPVRSVVCVEIESEVEKASCFFDHVNLQALKDPRVELVIGDARNYVFSTKRLFDVIVSEPSNPWIAGVNNLFTKELFDRYNQILRDGGMVSQWVHYYSMSPDDLKMITRTFMKSFPQTAIWGEPYYSDLILTGRKGHFRINFETIKRHLLRRLVARDMKAIKISGPEEILSFFFMGPAQASSMAGDGLINTDDMPYIEFSAPKSLYSDTIADNLELLFNWRESPFPFLDINNNNEELIENLHRRIKAAEEITKGMLFAYRGDLEKQVDLFIGALEIYPEIQKAREQTGEYLYRKAKRLHKDGKIDECVETLKKAIHYGMPSVLYHYSLGSVLQQIHKTDEAIRQYLKALSIDPDDFNSNNNLGVILLNLGNEAQAVKYFQKAIDSNPENVDAEINLGTALFGLNRLNEAENIFRKILSKKPESEEILLNLGVVLAKQEKAGEAEKIF